MYNIFKNFYESIMPKPKEHFEADTNTTFTKVIPMLLAVITVILIQLLIGKWLWNNYLVKTIPAIKPLESVIDLLAISILVKLVFF